MKTCTYKVCHMVPETVREDLHLHGLPHGAGRLREECTYKVCRMVPEQRVKTCTYKVCRMVPETVREDLHVQGLPHGSRDSA